MGNKNLELVFEATHNGNVTPIVIDADAIAALLKTAVSKGEVEFIGVQEAQKKSEANAF